MKSFWTIVSALFLAGSLAAEGSAVAAFAEKYEGLIKARLEEATMPRQRLEMEYVLRQNYALHLAEEETRTVRSGSIKTPEIEALRAQQDDLLKQIEALDKAIEEAARKAPVILELQDVMKVNEERIDAIRKALMQDSQTQAQPGSNP